MIQSFTLQRAPLEIGGEYWFQLEEDWLMPSPVFSILSAATIPGPGEKKIPQVNFCNIVNEKGRWLTQAPLMEWHSSLFKKFGGVFALDSDFQAFYNTALSKWASAQATAPSMAPVPPPWDATSVPWPPYKVGNPVEIEDGQFWGDYVIIDDITQGTGVISTVNAMNTGAPLSMSWMHDIPPQPDEDIKGEADLLVAFVDFRASGFVDTCLGHVSVKLTKSRTFWNSNSNAEYDGDPTKTYSSAGLWLHEVGHLLGLNHRASDCPGKSDAVMIGAMSKARSWETFVLSSDDQARIKALYPREVAFEGGWKKGC